MKYSLWLRGIGGVLLGAVVGVPSVAILAAIALPLGWPVFYGDDHQRFLLYAGALSVVLKAVWALFPAAGFFVLFPEHRLKQRLTLAVLAAALLLTWFLPWPSLSDL